MARSPIRPRGLSRLAGVGATTRRCCPTLEVLEDRLLLAANALLPVTVQIAGNSGGAATIRGTVFEDRTGTGQFSSNDPGVAGRTVFLDLNHDGKLDGNEPHTLSATDGSFVFTGLAPGTYTVCQVVPADWTPTSVTVSANPAFSADSSADELIDLDRFRADPRFAAILGQGETVVVLDTGIDADNPAFGPDANHDGVADSILYEHDFTSSSAGTADSDGHGTYVASIIASRNPNYPGIAPDVNLVVLKVLDNTGNGQFGNIDQALRWVLANATKYHIVCVNMSFGDGGDYTKQQSMYGIGGDLAALAAADVTVVAAAGNDYHGSDAATGLSYPAIDPNVIPVGAVWDANHGGPWVWANGARDNTTAPDRIVSFSQRLPGSGEVLAPGTMLTGAAPGGGTANLTGTSTAAAVVSGLVVLAQQLAVKELGHPLSVMQIRDLLNSSGVPIRDGQFEDDNVAHTGAVFNRVDAFNLGVAILNMGSVSTGPVPGSQVVSVPAGTIVAGVHLGTFHLGQVSGVVFDDTNSNGKLDPGETVLTGRVVFADANGNGKLDPGEISTHTDAQGQYTLTGLGPGTVEIRLDLWPGERQTTALLILTVTSDTDLASVDLGRHTSGINHAPTLNGDGTTSSIPEDAPNPSGVTVSTLLGSTFADVDPHAREGIAVIGLDASAQGQWQFSLDGGQTWRNIGPVYPWYARLLADNDRVRFLPSQYWSGTATITYRAWDLTMGSPGAMASLPSPGGSSAFSSATAQASVVVTHVNHAPIVLGTGKLTPISAGTANPPGDNITAILAGSVSDHDPGAKTGLALIGVVGQGTWQYSRDGGRTWSDLGVVSFARARLLIGSDLLRFLPAPGWNGSASITYRAWDQTTGTPGSIIDLTSWSLVGSSTAYSQEIGTAALHPASASTGPSIA